MSNGPPSLFSLLRTRLLLQLTRLKWRGFGAVQGGYSFCMSPYYLGHNSYAACEASAAAINDHDDYDGPDIGCSTVSALPPFGGDIATNWSIRW